MLDLRHVQPDGTVKVKLEDGTKALWIFSWEEGYGRKLASAYLSDHGREGEKKNNLVVKDIMDGSPRLRSVDEVHPNLYSDKPINACKTNFALNKPMIERSLPAREWPQVDEVIILGSGPSLYCEETFNLEKRDTFKITLNAAQSKVPGDVFIGIDWRGALSNLLKFSTFQDTQAMLNISTHPNIPLLPWKDINFFSSEIKTEYEIPTYYSGENVAFFALQFALKELKAKKIILIGQEHWIHSPASGATLYYWFGKHLEAACWWAARAGVEIWNCSDPGTVKGGCIHGTLNEALGG